MEVMFDRVAGLDVGKETVTVCLRTPGPNGRGTRDADVQDDDRVVAGDAGLAGRGWGEIAAMESTSMYWKPPFYCLEEVMEVWLLNAAHMKAVPGRKSDVRDAEWIAQLLEHGLLAPSLVPPPEIRRLRMLTRYREQPMGDRPREIVRLELMLEDATIELSSVASRLKTVSARAMLTAMIDGETRPAGLADLAKGQLRRKIPDLTQALTGHFDDQPCSAGPLDAAAAGPGRAGPGRAGRGDRRGVPAVAASDRAAANHSRSRAEGGAGVHRRDRCRHGAVPHPRPFGRLGRFGACDARVRRQTVPGRERHGNKWLTSMLVEAAGSVGRMHDKNYLPPNMPG